MCIYIYRERERYVYAYIYIYIQIYTKAKMGRTPDGRAEKLLEKLDSNSTTAGSPQDPEKM